MTPEIDDSITLKIYQIVRNANQEMMREFKIWATETLVLKSDYLEERARFEADTIGPLKIRIFGIWLALSGCGALITLLAIFK